MRAQHIVVGEDYEVKVWGSPERATVLEVGKITKRVGYHIAFSGYESERTRVRVKMHGWRNGHEEVIETNQVLRPWSEAAPILEEKERLDRALEEASQRLEKALKRIGINARVGRSYSFVHHKALEGISITVSLRDAQRLRRALRKLPKAARRRTRAATQVRDSLD